MSRLAALLVWLAVLAQAWASCPCGASVEADCCASACAAFDDGHADACPGDVTAEAVAHAAVPHFELAALPSALTPTFTPVCVASGAPPPERATSCTLPLLS